MEGEEAPADPAGFQGLNRKKLKIYRPCPHPANYNAEPSLAILDRIPVLLYLRDIKRKICGEDDIYLIYIIFMLIYLLIMHYLT